MNERVEQFHRVLDRMSLVEPASPELQEHIRRIKSTQFRKTLKRAGAYSLSFALISYVYFALKKAGISISIYKSAAIVALGSSITAASIGVGAYVAVKKITAPEEDIKIEKVLQKEKITASVSVPEKKETAVPDSLEMIRKRIGVQLFDSANVEDSLPGRVTDAIAGDLAARRGAGYVINRREEKSGKRAGMILKGSVEFLDGVYTVSAKVVDVQTSRVVYYTSETAASEKEIDGACGRIAKKIAASPAVPITEK
ncbi:MAG: hypothetical protein MUC95_02485 [Spirochaetes bacterium]|jgi:hypothetical protein|nr:hypothetical protein [Spirochaetota bacterium]